MPKRILVVEDEDAIRSVIADALRSEEFEIWEAQSGEEALAIIQQSPPDLVILDALMPGMDGFTLCQKIRQMPEPIKNMPIIILTALDTLLGERLGKEMGANLYLTKPFHPRELKKKVREFLT